jgi:cysteine desulfurase
MVEILRENYGNPSSSHKLGLLSKAALNKARVQVAQALGASDEEIYFTSGGTEANNLAIGGTCSANGKKQNHIVTTTVEHAAVTKPIREFKKSGWKVDYIPAPGGVLDLRALEYAITENTALVSIMLVNNEIGSIFPISKVREILNKKSSPALLHCDAVQGLGKIPFTVTSLGVDLLSISSHKIHGPKGAGALYIKQGTKIHPQLFGGGQERGFRSGTEATPAIVGFGEAAEITFSRRDNAIPFMRELRQYCLAELSATFEDVQINSPLDGAPHIINVSLPGVRSKDLLKYLSEHEIYISNAAACNSNHTRGPAILESLGVSREMSYSALRISFSASNTKQEIDELIKRIAEYRRTIPKVQAYIS